MIKLAFFDVDGTLSVPRFKKDNYYVIGFPPKKWKEFCEEQKNAAYKDCIAVQPIKRYAQELRRQGTKLYVLTASEKGYEEQAKKEFIKKNYPGLFEDIIISCNADEKINIILDYAAKNNISPCECELIEDTYMTLLDAQEKGIKPTHVSSIVAAL